VEQRISPRLRVHQLSVLEAMGILTRQRLPGERRTSAAPSVAAASTSADNQRASKGLKEFLWHLSDVERGHMLDLGPISQATVDFFTARKFKLYSNDLLREWGRFLAAEKRDRRLAAAAAGAAGGTAPKEDAEADPAVLAQRFIATRFDYPRETFHGVLAWDLLDYFVPELAAPFVARLHEIVRPGGAVLAVLHSRAPETLHRYRVRDAETLEFVPAQEQVKFVRVLPNREVLNLFSQFRSSKTFVGRDQIREAMFTR
jgi:hypothetical protein